LSNERGTISEHQTPNTKLNATPSFKMAPSDSDSRPMLGKKAAPAAEEENVKEQAEHDQAPSTTEHPDSRPMLGEKTPLAAEEESIKDQAQGDSTQKKSESSDTKPVVGGKSTL
jgi:hypothetical protein